MNKIKNHIELLQAFLDGQVIKYRAQKTHWYIVDKEHSWNFSQNEYKIVIPRDYALEIKGDTIFNIWKYDPNIEYASNVIHVREVL